jgi:hypothetical protein
MQSGLSTHLEKLDQVEINHTEIEFHLKTDLKLSSFIDQMMKLVEKDLLSDF